MLRKLSLSWSADVLEQCVFDDDDFSCSLLRLYASSKSCLWSGGRVSPLQWCRHVLDHPQHEAEATRRSLCQRLESGRLSMKEHTPVRLLTKTF